MRAFLLFQCLIGLLLPCCAEDSVPPTVPTRTIVAECQMVVLPQKIALPLLPELLDDAKIEGAYVKLQELIANGTAQLAANLVTKARDGEEGVAQSTEELRYATEFDPPRLPATAPNDLTILKRWPVVGITPTTFETRNIGTSLEVTAISSSEGRLLNVHAVPQHVRLSRWMKLEAGTLANGQRLSVEVPIFHSVRSECSLLLRNGQRVLLGVHKVPETSDTMELFLLRVSATPSLAP